MLIDKLSNEELDMFLKYIETYSDITGDCNSFAPAVSADFLLRFWNSEKDYLFHMMDDNLILSRLVSVRESDDSLREKMDDLPRGFLNQIDRIADTYWKLSYDFFGEKSLDQLSPVERLTYEAVKDRDLSDSELNLLSHAIYDLICTKALVKNRYDGETFYLWYGPGNEDKVKIERGCKVSKILGKIAKYFKISDGLYEDFRRAHSMALNQKMLSGELCLSIHPMDFITMSDNECGWRSCMSWKNYGEYRQGTVEMMNSGCVVCAYLKNPVDMQVPGGYTWNNKQWRCLYIVSDVGIISIKQYPYDNSDLDMICLNWLKDLATKSRLSVYQEELTEFWIDEDYGDSSINYDIDGQQFSLSINFETGIMYNDMYNYRHGYFTINPPPTNYYTFYYSGYGECMHCGCALDPDDVDPDELLCYDCSKEGVCDRCDCRYDKQTLISIDGLEVCPYCFNEESFVCPECKEKHIETNRFKLVLADDFNKSFSYLNGELIFSPNYCIDCAEAIKKSYHYAIDPYNRCVTQPTKIPTHFWIDYFQIKDYATADKYKKLREARIEYCIANGYEVDSELNVEI